MMIIMMMMIEQENVTVVQYSHLGEIHRTKKAWMCGIDRKDI